MPDTKPKISTIPFFLILCFLTSVPGQEKISESKPTIVNSEMIAMADGVKLATDVYLPAATGKFPCILVRTPYDKKNLKKEGEQYAADGHVVVVQDCRGKFLSEGVFYPFKNERTDGLATVAWIRAQSWCNGRIGGRGGSYVGYTQWAIADVLDVITPELTSAHMYELLYPGGMFSLATAFNWGLVVAAQTVNPVQPQKILASYTILPLAIADDSTTKDIDYLNDWLAHSSNDAYWHAMNHRAIAKAPVLTIAGWYDIFLMPQVTDFLALDEKVQQHSRMVIGPWCHGSQAVKNEYGGSDKTGHRSRLIKGFLNRHLQDTDFDMTSSGFKDKKYNLFVMERNEYYGADTWPPRATVVTGYYFGPDHYLAPAMPPNEGKLEYTYDPANPMPNKGGTLLGVGVGPALQNDNLERTDQLMFETQVLPTPLILLGPIAATLHVSSDVACTDFIVCLQDVFPDGNIINIQEGGSRVNLVPGINRVDISVWASGYQLNPGHKLRAVITSSWFPRYNRNLNTGEPIYSATTMKIARQSVYFGNNRSMITLPILQVTKDEFSD